MALLSVKQIAAEIGVSESTIKRAVYQREIPAERIGKLLRFDLEDVRRAMRENAAKMHTTDDDRARRGTRKGPRREDKRPREGNTGARIAAPKR